MYIDLFICMLICCLVSATSDTHRMFYFSARPSDYYFSLGSHGVPSFSYLSGPSLQIICTASYDICSCAGFWDGETIFQNYYYLNFTIMLFWIVKTYSYVFTHTQYSIEKYFRGFTEHLFLLRVSASLSNVLALSVSFLQLELKSQYLLHSCYQWRYI